MNAASARRPDRGQRRHGSRARFALPGARRRRGGRPSRRSRRHLARDRRAPRPGADVTSNSRCAPRGAGGALAAPLWARLRIDQLEAERELNSAEIRRLAGRSGSSRGRPPSSSSTPLPTTRATRSSRRPSCSPNTSASCASPRSARAPTAVRTWSRSCADSRKRSPGGTASFPRTNGPWPRCKPPPGGNGGRAQGRQP